MQSNSLTEDGQCLLTLAFIMWQNTKYAKALVILEGLRHLEPESDDYLPLLCVAYLDNSLYKEAIEIGRLLLTKTTGQEYLFAAKLCATALFRSNKQAEAKELMEQALEMMNASTNE